MVAAKRYACRYFFTIAAPEWRENPMLLGHLDNYEY